MPHLQLAQPYKSISSLDPVSIPQFTVLTGPNGSGKTHILEAIASGDIKVTGDDKAEIGTAEITLLTWSDLVPNDTHPADPIQIARSRAEWWHQLDRILSRDGWAEQVRNKIGSALFDHLNRHGSDLFDIDRDTFAAAWLEVSQGSCVGSPTDAQTEALESSWNAYRSVVTKSIEGVKNQIERVQELNVATQHVLKTLDIDLMQLTQADFEANLPLYNASVNPFQQALSEMFATYQKEFIDNWYNRKMSEDGEDVGEWLTDEDFIASRGRPPWEFLNEILLEGGFDFQVTSPNKKDRDQAFTAELLHLTNGARIQFSDLSSGEKVLISLTMAFYNTEEGRVKVDYPKLLLFDEVDAPLHPAMVRSLLRTIRNTLIEKCQIAVILTTHSPTTAAIAEGDSLRQVNKSVPRITETSQASALRLLTSGVPSLTVQASARLQVFVESNYDVEYYDTLVEALSRHSAPTEMSLDFLPSSPSKSQGGCDLVRALTSQLVESGVTTARGLVDWDAANSPQGNVFVLGGGRRYSIENYALDPLLMAGLFARLKMHKVVTRQMLGLSSGVLGGLEFPKADTPFLQGVVDRTLALIKPTAADSSSSNVQLVGGQTVRYPNWFLTHNGHDLVARYRQLSEEEFRRFDHDSKLCLQALQDVAIDTPHLLPIELVKTLDELATT